jgi:NAD(P)-dependent dehydrogenase (short-subunit alcohol dehydrogenase family)
MKLQGKVAVVTGGARGIGRAIAERYAREGARVCVADIGADAATQAAAAIGSGAFATALDVTDQRSIDAMIDRVVETAGGIDILVNNAGVFSAGTVEEVTRESWGRTLMVNTEGTLFTMQAVARQMIRQDRGGKIINMSSQAGRRGRAMVLAYCASKAAVISITQSAALHLIKYRINVNAIAPGVVDTEMWDTIDLEFSRREGRARGESRRIAGETVPLGRMARPEELGGIAVFLASEDANYIVAQTYGVDGGNWTA